MTSPAAVAYRDEERLINVPGGDLESIYLERIMPAKLELDLEYIEQRSLWLDVRVLARTAGSVFTSLRSSE